MTKFWALGRRSGANCFFLAPQGIARFGHEIHISAPRGKRQPAIEIDEGLVIHRYRGAISNPRKPLPVRLARARFAGSTTSSWRAGTGGVSAGRSNRTSWWGTAVTGR